ncbi:zinc-binding dehydrogenase [Amycolatopsis endophytica]|uniref:D-arabinose 1-dehydrogenase-like Zn-dependent alcohol dehydrogenase n=1 Tax=Amycolatopsis endophytica TaxID=860233 RepID=A0A853BEH5_9PSEU|nr:zinc-binding dehydrogenase [Amycolatopsis endophytica]NYI93175.1 D-arabinose 1-dehydrogenase-like Zn-dependent alcohol dehydrogenase [Amycolatopsis endophytica]
MSTTTGRAAVMEDYGAEFTVREFPRPVAEPGGLVVEIDVATVCGSDVHAWQGHLAGVLPISPPLILGHEMTGRVVEIGAGADVDSAGQDLRVGDRVVWAHTPCGRCHECTVERQPVLCARRYIGYLNDCSVPPHFTGTFAEYGVVRPDAGRIRVPDTVESGWASAGSCALRTVVRALSVAGPVGPEDTVVVQGAGPLGLFATALLSLHDPRRLVVVGGPEDRLELAREWGATHTVPVDPDADPAGRVDEVLGITGRGASVAFELAGAPGVVTEGVRMMARNGRYVVMGTLGGPPQPVHVATLVSRGITLRGSMSGEIGDYHTAMGVLDRYRDRFAWDRLLGSTYGLEHLADAMSAMRRMDEIKPVIRPRQG